MTFLLFVRFISLRRVSKRFKIIPISLIKSITLCGNFKYHAGILTPVSFSYALILRPPLKKYPHLLETQIVLASGLQIHSILFFYILQQYFYKKNSEYQEKYKYCFQYHNIRTKKDCQLSFLSYQIKMFLLNIFSFIPLVSIV